MAHKHIYDHDFRVSFDVFGTYTHGKLKGKTNPRAVTSMTMFGESVKDCVGKLKGQIDGCIYKITDVVSLGE